MVWLPDIVLYNNADPKFEKAMDTNVIIKFTVSWPFIVADLVPKGLVCATLNQEIYK